MRHCNNIFWILVLCSFFFTACERKSPFEPSISQGIWGRIEFWDGNFMPFTPTGKVTYVKRRILFFEKTHLDNVVRESPGSAFYLSVNSILVDFTESNNNGYFEIQLPVGEYSVFVWEENKYYANRSDGQGYIFPVNVEKDTITEITFIIDYLATY